MEVGLREWLIVGAIIVIILIVVDGWRRMRAQSNTLKIDIDDKLSELGDDEYNPELPLGSARIFKAQDDADNSVAVKSVAAKVVDKVAADKKVASSAHSNSSEKQEKPTTENKVTHSNHSPDLTPSIQPPQTTDFSDDGLSAVRVASSPSSTRVEPVFDESTLTSDNSLLDENIEVSSVPDSESVTEEFEGVLNAPASSDVQFTAQNPELDPMRQSNEVKESQIPNDDSLIVPDILKKSADHVSELERDTGDSRENLQVDVQNKADDIATEPASSEEDLKQEKAAKENTDNIVNNLLTTLAKSKKTQPESDTDAANALESHYHERVRKEENSVLVADKFEQLLAEKTASSSYEIDEVTEVALSTGSAISDLADSHLSSNDEHSKADAPAESLIEENNEENDSEPRSLDSEAASRDELDAIATKQKEIDALKAKLEELSAQEIAKSQQLREAELNNIETTPLESANDVEIAVTTVIDDEVNLEDLASEVTKLPDDLDLEPLEEFLNEVVEEEVELDPLMDGFNDEAAANELVSQFEEDLEEDQQAVSNELDMPITEILKKQLAYSSGSEEAHIVEVTEHEEEDPLLEENQLPESLLSGAHFDTEQIDDADQDDELDEADNLGFNAFDQGEMSDPLMDDFVDESAQAEDIEEPKEIVTEHQQKSFFDDHEEDSQQAASVIAEVAGPLSVSEKKARKAISNVDDPNAVLIVTVVAKEHYLNGAALRRVVEACGMEFGDMEVFHRFEDGADSGAVQFSMANAINPGTFNIEEMDETSTPGVSFFMSMDEPEDAKKALECMLATAETVALHLHGDLLDDDRSVLRPQTKEHYRERVRIHTMKKLRKRAQ